MKRRIILLFLAVIVFWGINPCRIQAAEDRGIKNSVVSFRTDEGKEIVFYRRSYALLIGVWDYDYWPKFKKENIEKDLEDVKTNLERHGFKVIPLLNPGSRQMKAALETFRNDYGLDTNNRLLILFSGHGCSRKNHTKGYLVPRDAPRPERDINGFLARAVDMVELKALAERIEARHVLFLFDSCFSGTILRTRANPVPGLIREEMVYPARQFITAGKANQRVPEKSVFIPALLRGLGGEADLVKDGYITGIELYLYIESRVKKNPVKQDPQYGSLMVSEDEGNIIFLSGGKKTASPPEAVDIDIGDLKAWSLWLQKFKENVIKLKDIDQDPNISPRFKKQKWQELLNAYSKDDPYSEEDEQLRTYVKERIAYLEREKENPFGEEINRKAKRIYKNDKGYWEADYGDGIVMVYIPPGDFIMGQTDDEKKWLIDEIGEKKYNDYYNDEGPLHKVYLDGYWIGKTEVTVGQFKRFVEDKGYKTDAEKGGGAYTWTGKEWKLKEDINWKNPGFKHDDSHPVVCVSWNDAKAYCDWLSTGKDLTFKLPTEAQWEKAARGADRRKYPWGDHDPYYNENWYANYAAHNSWSKRGEDGFEFTAPVGSYPQGASPYVLMDMAGNVWEWCSDWHEKNYYKNSPRKNPTGPESGSLRVLRGGGWGGYARFLRCADRDGDGPSNRVVDLGFRLCQEN